MGLEHGGRLRQAARTYGIPLDEWLDLSTGIHPLPWPGAAELQLPLSAWSRLPEDEDELAAAACQTYGAGSVLPVAGTQAAIQALPRLRRLHQSGSSSAARVAVETPSYAEHAQAWQRNGDQVRAWRSLDADASLLDRLDVLVLLQPNNPTGLRNPVARLLAWHERLQAHGGWLVIDEAYVDATPEWSLAAHTQRPGLIVLRSLGKFFGLPGARVGFVLAAQKLLDQLAEQLGPWPIAGPSRWLAARALQDMDWQARQRPWLIAQAQRLAELLSRHGLTPSGGCALFQWLIHEQAAHIHQQLAQRAILVRLFQPTADQPEQAASLRFGLPGTGREWQRLERALKDIQPCKP